MSDDKFRPSQASVRLDAATSALFYNQLAHIAPKAFDVKRAPLLAMQSIPLISGVDEDAEVFKFRGHELVGSAGLGTDKANTPNRADVKGYEAYQPIVTRWSSFVYSQQEIRSASKAGIPLQMHKMTAAIRAVEQLLDKDLALGDAALGLKGALRQSGTTTESPASKSTGLTSWVGATPEEMALDVMALLDKIASNTDDDNEKFDVYLPRTKYRQLRGRIGDGAGTTSALEFLRSNCENLGDIKPWNRCTLAGGSLDATRMAAWPRNPDIVGGLVPKQPSLGNMVQGLMETEQVVEARSGGTVAFYPLYIGYMDGI